MAVHYNQSQPPVNAVQWSVTEPTSTVMEKLKLLTHTEKPLRKNGYVLNPLSEQEIWSKRRCRNCGTKIKGYRPGITTSVYQQESSPLGDVEENSYYEDCYHEEVDQSRLAAQEHYAREIAKASASTARQPTKRLCFFHDGKAFKGIYDCCGGRNYTKGTGCCSNISHVAGNMDELRDEWLFEKTPEPVFQPTTNSDNLIIRGRGQGRDSRRPRGRGRGRFSNAHNVLLSSSPNTLQPLLAKAKDVRPVVALDCEMGTTTVGSSVLIRLSLVDFFTQEPLIDSLVAPTVPMEHYNTKHSGVTFSAMRNAVRTSNVINGTTAARHALFKYVDADTIMVVHGGSSDFAAL